MNLNSELILIESKSARDIQLANATHEKAEDVLSKAKALLHFVVHQGSKIATTEQVAEFYEVSTETIQKAFQRHRDEFESDGVKVLKGKALKDVVDRLSTTSKAPQATAWNPRGAVRLGMILRDSEVAKAVRTASLDANQISAEKDDEIEKLKLQLAIAQANNSTVLTQERLLLTGQAIVAMHGAPMLALIQGRPNAVVTEKEVVRETVMVDRNLNPVATFDGMGITEVAKRLGFGTTKKDIAQCRKWLESVGIKDEDWRQEMTAHASAKLPRELMPKLRELWMQRKGNRQMLLGE